MKQIVKELDGYKTGDWVRFYHGGSLVIGKIEYLWIKTGGLKYAATDIVSISLDSILEKRSAVDGVMIR